MKHAFRLSRACAAVLALAAVFGAASRPATAQTLSPSPETAIFQVTSTFVPATPTPTPTASPSPTATPTPTPGATPAPIPRDSFASDTSGSGRFVVIESSGDIATDRTPDVRDASGNLVSRGRNNADGNQEIFLFDYAQRRIFQITNTRSVLKDAARSSIDPTNIDIQIVNLQPTISRDGRFIAFISNAYSDAAPGASPRDFDGSQHAAALRTDANTEVFIYRIPDVADVDLSLGTEVATVDLAVNTPQRVTFTPATAAPLPAFSNTTPAFFARDNESPMLNDDGSLLVFVSKARAGIPGADNADGNKDIFLYRNSGAGSFLQLTATKDIVPAGSKIPSRFVFSVNPSISSCPAGGVCRIAFLSNADNVATEGQAEVEANRGNGEVFVAEYNTTSGERGSVRQVTRTPPDTTLGREGVSVNLLTEGRRISRDGSRIVFESTVNSFNPDGTPSGGIVGSTAVFIANVAGGSPAFAQVSTRAPADQLDVELHFPTFTGDSARVVWVSNLNLRPDGTVATTAAEGLNQLNRAQVFSARVDALTTVARVTDLLTGSFTALQPLPSDSIRRIALSSRTEEGGSNADSSSEAFYQLIPVVNSETPAPSPTPATSPAPVSFFTGPSDRPVVAPSPTPTPPAVTSLAPAMLGIARSTLALAPAEAEVDPNDAHETQRRPPLPLELSGVTVTVSGAAAGLYSVAPNQINFVVPAGLTPATTALPVAIFNNGALIRTSLLLTTIQPDIFTSTNGPGGRAAALNTTNPCVSSPGEPFAVTTSRPAGSGTTGVCTSPQTETVATQVTFLVSGIRGVGSNSNVTVRIGATDIVGTADLVTSPVKVSPTNTPGFDQVTVTLPASLAGAGDVPVIISVTSGGVTFASRPADTAPRITIQ
ncbi:MAG TPA: hypothetical protein VF668_05095 [Pyrinomonadaceae bacterium]